MLKKQLDQMLQIDREDLLAVLDMRFGPVTKEVKEEIETIQKAEVLERLILAAANVPNWEGFVTELKEGKETFKLAGNLYDPLSMDQRRR